MPSNLVIGAGEVGTSLYGVLKDAYPETYIRDREPGEDDPETVDFLHICIPPFPGFQTVVMGYQLQYSPKVTVIHSSVPIGTSRSLNAVHSPIHGKHPDLRGGILTFTKYIGAERPEDAEAVAKLFLMARIPHQIVSNPETSEHSKLACTRKYGLDIVEMKEVERECEEYGTNFDEVYGWKHEYNAGYAKLGMSHFTRPILKPMKGQIGGHCVLNNCQLNPDGVLEKFILERNETYAEPPQDHE